MGRFIYGIKMAEEFISIPFLKIRIPFLEIPYGFSMLAPPFLPEIDVVARSKEEGLSNLYSLNLVYVFLRIFSLESLKNQRDSRFE